MLPLDHCCRRERGRIFSIVAGASFMNASCVRYREHGGLFYSSPTLAAGRTTQASYGCYLPQDSLLVYIENNGFEFIGVGRQLLN